MSVVRYQCPFCGQTYDGESTDAGAVGTCEQCGRDFPLVVIATPVTQKRPSGISWYFGMFRKCFSFKGRASRREFLWAYSFHLIATFLVGVLSGLFDWNDAFFGIVLCICAIPTLSLFVRRLHDTDKSGWWLFLPVVPVVQFAFLTWMLQKGDQNANRFGSPPAL